jgi:hypothetical protein
MVVFIHGDNTENKFNIESKHFSRRNRQMLRQKTFYVNNQKITIKSRPKSYMCNPNGFYVWINNIKYWSPYLEREKAEDHCYVRWVKQNVEQIIKGEIDK